MDLQNKIEHVIKSFMYAFTDRTTSDAVLTEEVAACARKIMHDVINHNEQAVKDAHREQQSIAVRRTAEQARGEFRQIIKLITPRAMERGHNIYVGSSTWNVTNDPTDAGAYITDVRVKRDHRIVIRGCDKFGNMCTLVVDTSNDFLNSNFLQQRYED